MSTQDDKESSKTEVERLWEAMSEVTNRVTVFPSGSVVITPSTDEGIDAFWEAIRGLVVTLAVRRSKEKS